MVFKLVIENSYEKKVEKLNIGMYWKFRAKWVISGGECSNY